MQVLWFFAASSLHLLVHVAIVLLELFPPVQIGPQVKCLNECAVSKALMTRLMETGLDIWKSSSVAGSRSSIVSFGTRVRTHI